MKSDMSTFVLIHGAWHGGWCWSRVAKLLRAQGHEVHTPTLAGMGEHAHLASKQITLDTHIEDVVNYLEAYELTDVVLAGHSYGCAIITAAADRLDGSGRIGRVVYVDGSVPRDGDGWFTTSKPEQFAARNKAAQDAGGLFIPPPPASGFGLSPGAGMAGTGQLAAILLTESAHIYQLAGELEGNPSLYALPSAQTPVVIAPPAPANTGGLLPPGAPASNPAFASAGEAPPTPEKRKAGRPKKDTTVQDTAPLAPVAASPDATPAAPTPPPAPVSPFSSATQTSGLEVYVNCRPMHATLSLHDYIDHINAELAKRYCTGGIQDIRCAPKDSPLAFGGWKGALHEIVRTNPPQAGAYHLDTDGNEMADIVSDAMRAVCVSSGASYVRGVR